MLLIVQTMLSLLARPEYVAPPEVPIVLPKLESASAKVITVFEYV